MSFKTNKNELNDWKEWLKQNRKELVCSGVPEEIYENQRRWFGLLEEGFDYKSKWKPDILSEDEAKIFHNFIIRNYGENEYRSLLFDIESKFDLNIY